MKKLNNVLLTFFGIGIIVVLFAGALSVVGYIIALFVGGTVATDICTFVFKSYLPWVIKATSIFAGIGLVTMYLSKQKALSVKSESKEK